MITKIWFKRTAQNVPVVCLEHKHHDNLRRPPVFTDVFQVSEELYDQWVPDTNHFPGESLSEGVVYDKPLVPNLKAPKRRR